MNILSGAETITRKRGNLEINISLIVKRNKQFHLFELYVHEIPPVGLLFKDLQEKSRCVMSIFARNCDWDKSAEQALLPKLIWRKKEEIVVVV